MRFGPIPPPPAGADPTANTRTCKDVGGGHFECDATLHPPPPRGRGPHSEYTHLHRRGWRPFWKKEPVNPLVGRKKIDKSKPPTLKHVHIGTHQPSYPGTVTAPVIMSIFSLIHEYCYYSVQKITKEYNFVSNLNRIVDIISLFLLLFFFSVAKRSVTIFCT